MPYTLLHDGVIREFDFYAPTGWEHWVGKAWEKGRTGLPLVVALHGGGQDPLDFQEKWFFPRLWNLELDDDGNPGEPVPVFGNRVLENQFFVLYPYGTGWTTETLTTLAYALVEPPAVPAPVAGADPRPLYRDGRTVRAWNIGIGGERASIDDVGFIEAACDAMHQILKSQLLYAEGAMPADFPWIYLPGPMGFVVRFAPDIFDVDRRYLFGYSNGAMLGHRLVSRMPDYWAALWAMSGSCGGKLHVGVTGDDRAVVNLPDDGSYAVSLFAHHGDLDDTVPPGDWGEDDFVYQSASGLSPGYLLYATAGFQGALDYRPGLLPLSQASRGYRTYNNVDGQSPFRSRPDLNGGETAQSKSWPDAADPNDENPTVVIYRDPLMGHTGFTESANRYFREKDVWRFFGYHPRVPR
jgi:poly(3-hydroxybutyrate) depolymerase